MVRKLGITGMDTATETQLREAFARAQSSLGERWELAPEAQADQVIVDMDSMYGPMSWIRLHAAGKQVIGLTTSPRTQADHRLERPFDSRTLGLVLAEIETQAPAREPDADPEQAAAPVAEAPPSSATPAPAPADQLPEEQAIATDEESMAPAEPAAALEPVAAAVVEPEPPAAAPPPRDPVLADWFLPGALPGRWRYGRDGASVVFDNDARVYHGPSVLKPLASLFEGVVRQTDLEPLDQAAWSGAIAGLGDPQPLARLQWYAGLLAGKGELLPAHDPEGKYRLARWPQTEREFPKHFRIATAMMKGPATVAEVAAASGVAQAEVADFVNANLASGHAEFVPPPAPEPSEPPRPTGLFGRLRGR